MADEGMDLDEFSDRDGTDDGEDDDENRYFYTVGTDNRFEQKENGGGLKRVVVNSKKRKKRSNGSGDGFASMEMDEKLVCIFDQVNRNYDKIGEMEKNYERCRDDVRKVNKENKELDRRISRMEELCQAQAWNIKVLSYKSVDNEARDMRNNIIIYGLTERLTHHSCKSLVLGFLENELDIDTTEIRIERAHRMGNLADDKYCGKQDPRRPMIIRFRDYVDTEMIMSKVYKLKGSRFGVDRQYPKEISKARSELYNSTEAKRARENRQKVQIRYPARLFIDGRCVSDKFPEWYKILGTDRLSEKQHVQPPSKTRDRIYSDKTVIDVNEEQRGAQDSVFASDSESESSENETGSSVISNQNSVPRGSRKMSQRERKKENQRQRKNVLPCDESGNKNPRVNPSVNPEKHTNNYEHKPSGKPTRQQNTRERNQPSNDTRSNNKHSVGSQQTVHGKQENMQDKNRQTEGKIDNRKGEK